MTANPHVASNTFLRKFILPSVHTAVIERYSENACAEGTLECGSARYRGSLEFQGGSFAAALQGASRIFMVSGCPSADGRERLP
jgi:hypothetical protein